MKLQTLLAGVPHKGPALDPEITAVVYDSRKAGPGALFVCLPGERADGHDYAPAAYQAGCRAFLAQALGRDCPVAFLNFSNGALKNLDSWHWVPLISMTEGERVLLCTILDEGEERVIDLDLWLDTTFLGGALVTLWPDPDVGHLHEA